MKTHKALIGTTILLLGVFLLPAATPQAIKVQGFLSDRTGGTPAPAIGTYTMTFELWDAADGGLLMIGSGPLPVQVQDGMYEVELPFAGIHFDDGERYLQVIVNGEALTPRIRLVSSPYAYSSERAASADEADMAISVAPGSIVSASLAPAAVDQSALATGSVTADKLGISCAPGEILVHSGSGWACSPISGMPICSPGDFISCYSGPIDTMGVGVCKPGIRLCNIAGTGFESCTGELAPSTEACDGLDNDCNGFDDAGNPGVGGQESDNDGDGQAECAGDCDDSNPTTYSGAVEICNGEDNDCDGETDEACIQCTADEQACMIGCLDFCGGDISCSMTCIDDCGLSSGCESAKNTLFVCGATAGCSVSGDVDEMLNCLRANCRPEWIDVLGPDCQGGEVQACGTNVGECQTGTQTCLDGLWDPNCVGSVDPVPEACDDGLDNDCDDEIDESGRLWYPDIDGDGYGDWTSEPLNTCELEPGYVENSLDCQDDDPDINPDAGEVCDEVDNNCNGQTDEGFLVEWYYDGDGDGYGDGDNMQTSCDQPPGFVANYLDCDDSDPNNFPGNLEVCDGQDNDCNGVVDEGLDDADGDGWSVCTDCDDLNPNVFPGATEICDGLDNDCNGVPLVTEVDADGDGYSECEGDCNDADPMAFPGQSWYPDCDGDGFAGSVAVSACGPAEANAATPCLDGQPPDGGWWLPAGADCDDEDTEVNPAAPEICNGKDDNCNSFIDQADVPVFVMCPPGPNVNLTQCNGALGCAIQACAAGYLDLDGLYSNGCEYQQ